MDAAAIEGRWADAPRGRLAPNPFEIIKDAEKAERDERRCRSDVCLASNTFRTFKP
jgi:hypothetical protein